MAVKASASITLTRVDDGATGERGAGIYKVTTAPSSYTTATGGFTPTYRISLSTVKSQSGATEIIVGDQLRYSYYLYPVGYVDSSYVYCDARQSIRGSAGAAGEDACVISDEVPTDTTKLWLDTSIEPHILKEYDGENWVKVNDYAEDLANQKVTITEEYNAAIKETAEAINLLVSKLTTSVNQNTESISGINNQITLTAEDIAFIKTTTETLQSIVDGKVDSTTIQEWARFDGAQLELGASNSPFKAIMTNTELGFWQGDTKVSWISNNELHVLTAVITTAIGVGNGRLIDEGDDGVSFIMIT